MNIILYTSDKKINASKRLLDRISSDYSCDNIETFSNMADFIKRLYNFPRKIDVAVIFTMEESQLSDLVQYRDNLEDIEIILILPDQNKDTVSKGMSLYPRFLAYMDSNFDDVSAVISKLRIKRTNANTSANSHIA
ncbi:MAG: hypothetical protein PVG39_11035 [Desulfobacteraceae bacterium]|jgi:hypothetical protein